MPEQADYTTDYVRPLFPLELGCQLRMRINVGRGRIAGFVVQLELEVDGQISPVVRYDCAHGQPHRDTLNPRGVVIAKEWLPLDYDRALDQATRDVVGNWRRYREDFLAGMV